MKTMINIRVDQDVKDKAKKTAEALGMPLSTVINAYLKQFNRTKEVHFSVEGDLTAKTKQKLKKLHDDVVAGKNLSESFKNINEAIVYLRS